jgi:nucleotide-binding universal stress UspA family protein
MLQWFYVNQGEMMMYQRILVPVDKSETSKRALLEAARLADNQQAILRVAHVIDLAQFAWGANELVDVSQLQQGLREAGHHILNELVLLLNAYNLHIETALIEIWGGALSEGIIEETRRCKADLIVMGTHGYSGLTHLLLGSVAEGVMRATDVPILLVRHKETKLSHLVEAK